MWRLHPDPKSKWRVKGPDWEYCADPDCSYEHVEYEPFRQMTVDLKGDPR
jgi:hypothetical protein